MALPFQPKGKRRKTDNEGRNHRIWEKALPAILGKQVLHKLLAASEITTWYMLTESSAGKGKITKQVHEIKIFLLHFLM